MSTEDSSPSNGDIPPFIAEAVEEIRRLTQFGRMTSVGFQLGANLGSLTSVLKRAVKKAPEALPGLHLLNSLTAELQGYARAESECDMPYLSRLLAIQFVTIIESAVQDAILASLEVVPGILERDEIKRIKGPVAELLAASPAERAEFFAAALAQEVKGPLQMGVAKFESVLQAVGLAGSVDAVARRVIHELIQVRNVLVHRSGRADSRLCKSCPWLELKPNERVSVTSEMIERYRAAAVYYLIELIHRWLRRDGIRADMAQLDRVGAAALEKLQASGGAG